MPKNNEIKVAANNSNRNYASGHDTTSSVATVNLPCSNPYSIPTFEDYIAEVKRRFAIEKDAKNMAYRFILSKGFLHEFEAFCRDHRYEDHHAACLSALYPQFK